MTLPVIKPGSVRAMRQTLGGMTKRSIGAPQSSHRLPALDAPNIWRTSGVMWLPGALES